MDIVGSECHLRLDNPDLVPDFGLGIPDGPCVIYVLLSVFLIAFIGSCVLAFFDSITFGTQRFINKK